MNRDTLYTIYIGLGANLNQPIEQLKWAFTKLKELPNSKLVAISSLYGSKPLGPQDQPDYINAAACLETYLSPEALLDNLQQIELNAGRVRKEDRWGPRTLDLDILMIDDLAINSKRLTVPHYDMTNREFVIFPLLEIEKTLRLPSGQSIESIARDLPLNGLSIIENISIEQV